SVHKCVHARWRRRRCPAESRGRPQRRDGLAIAENHPRIDSESLRQRRDHRHTKPAIAKHPKGTQTVEHPQPVRIVKQKMNLLARTDGPKSTEIITLRTQCIYGIAADEKAAPGASVNVLHQLTAPTLETLGGNGWLPADPKGRMAVGRIMQLVIL